MLSSYSLIDSFGLNFTRIQSNCMHIIFLYVPQILFHFGHAYYEVSLAIVIYLLKFNMINKYYYYKVRFKVQRPTIFPNTVIGNGTRKLLVFDHLIEDSTDFDAQEGTIHYKISMCYILK